jgi:hypothetical protein
VLLLILSSSSSRSSLTVKGLCYHMQSVTAYFTMSLISPVSQSVANTFKRSLLIVISIWYFGNAINVWSAIGMITVVFGVVLYNVTRRWQNSKNREDVKTDEPTLTGSNNVKARTSGENFEVSVDNGVFGKNSSKGINNRAGKSVTLTV